jgi:signal transduction histidine kinase
MHAKPILVKFADRYLTALRLHLSDERPAVGERAQMLGRSALAGGMATLDLARVHEQAMLTLAPTYDLDHLRGGAIKRAGVFFTQALIPLESAQRAIRGTNAHLQVRNLTLRRHTAALALANRRLRQEVLRRKGGEVTIRMAKERFEKLFRTSQVMQAKLQFLTRQIIAAQEEERKEISRELHDEVVQSLVGIKVQLTALGREASLSLRGVKAKIARTQRLVTNSVNAVHRFARELRPAVLDDLGLIPALHAYCNDLAKRKRIKIRLTALSRVEDLDNAKRTVLYRVAQEALTNVVRHAQASLVRIAMSEGAGWIQMDISDNGKSFPVGDTLLSKNPKRLGLIGMKERVEMVGGSLKIDSAVGTGTTVRVRIPFKSLINHS